ncbi:MAG: formylglycine-generating enzyme family protein [Leptolyngbya sp. SIO1D8]|nr:formylglycine-generating enzyme family protein [Leptolyngbya sp. SIO1D8]
MVQIPGGRFWMGSPKNEKGRSEAEGPIHSVTVPAFAIGKYPVTQAQWSEVAALPRVKLYLDPFPAYFKGAKCPTEQVNWYEAVEFCKRLSYLNNHYYRLPSEAEWEYACRARTTTPFHFGETINTDQVNCNGTLAYGSGMKGNYRARTTDVDGFPANAFGLHDMHGNIFEWCQDGSYNDYQYAPTDGSAWTDVNNQDGRVIRGGSWKLTPRYCRSAYRYLYHPRTRDNTVGFRVAY